MEIIRGTHKASNFAPEGIITSMPDDVVTNILNRLPLQDAVRTSILSRNWRFKWTMLTQLVFDKTFFNYLLEKEGENNYERIISRFLLHLRGAITKCVLYIGPESDSVLDNEDINHWIWFLSTRGIKDLTFCKDEGLFLLPNHLFSCLELKHLKLDSCCFNPPASFLGFPNLLSLEVHCVPFESGEVVKFFTRCPVLEILIMGFNFPASCVKLDDIAKLSNLRILSFRFCNLDNKLVVSSSIIFELMGSLPKLEELYLNFLWCEFVKDGAKKRSPTTFPCLKTLRLADIELENSSMLSCALEMIRSSPNLQTFEIIPRFPDYIMTPEACSLDVDYDTMGPSQLRSVVFTYMACSDNELCLIKYILACSPFLKKIVIHPLCLLEDDDQLVFATELLKLHRASPDVDFDLN